MTIQTSSNQPDTQAGDSQPDFVAFAETLGYRNPMYLPQPIKDCISKAQIYAERLAANRALEEARLARKQFTEAASDNDFIVANGERIAALSTTLTKEKKK